LVFDIPPWAVAEKFSSSESTPPVSVIGLVIGTSLLPMLKCPLLIFEYRQNSTFGFSLCVGQPVNWL
jgi:hypothetical protein